MKYELKQNGEELTVAVEGRLDTATAPELENAVEPYLKTVSSLIFDFGKLEYVSSAGLRMIAHAHLNKCQGGFTKAVNCNAVVKEVFEVTGFYDFITVE